MFNEAQMLAKLSEIEALAISPLKEFSNTTTRGLILVDQLKNALTPESINSDFSLEQIEFPLKSCSFKDFIGKTSSSQINLFCALFNTQ